MENIIVSKIAFTVLAFLLTACSDPETADALACRDRDLASVQVLVGRLDAGQTTREAYRLTENGMFSRATWNDQNKILAVYEAMDIGIDAYSSALTTLSEIEPTPIVPTDDGLAPSPSFLTIEIASSRADAPTDFVFRNESTVALDQLIGSWQQLNQATVELEGSYVWTMAAPAEAGDSDLTISQPDCDVGMIRIVDEGVLGPDVVISASEGVDQFASINRSRFIARSTNGFVYFAVLSPI